MYMYVYVYLHLFLFLFLFLPAAQSHGLDIMAGVLARSLPDPYSVEVISKQSRSSTTSGKEKEKKEMEKEKNAFKVSPPSESNDCTNSPGADLNLILFDEVIALMYSTDNVCMHTCGVRSSD